MAQINHRGHGSDIFYDRAHKPTSRHWDVGVAGRVGAGFGCADYDADVVLVAAASWIVAALISFEANGAVYKGKRQLGRINREI